MGIMSKKSHATITAPLKKMATALESYCKEQESNIVSYDSEIMRLEKKKSESKTEIKKSSNTVSKIKDFISIDLDDDEIPDIDEVEILD